VVLVIVVNRETAISEMLLPHQQSLLTELIQNTVVRVCVEHVPFDGRLELDGLVCINSDVGGSRQIVVKIHTVVGRKDVFAERMVVPKTTWPLIPFAVGRNGLSQSTDDAVVQDARSVPCEDVSSAASETLEDGGRRSGEVVADECLPPWSRHAPQILKLLTKSDAVPDTTSQPPPSEAGPICLTVAEKTSDAVVKRELAPNEDASAMEVDAASGDRLSAKWRCKMCQLLCEDFADLEAHMRNVHVRFVCRLCLNSFTLSCNLRRHMKLHAGVRPHSCPCCSASFSRSTDLKIHMKKHPAAQASTAQASSDCDSPMLVQVEPLSLKKATILHECESCGKGFAAAAHLEEHRRTHNNNAESHPVTENSTQNSVAEPVSGKTDSSCKSHAINGTASQNKDSVGNIATGPVDFAETVREFAPLFHLGDAGMDTVESDKETLFLASITQHKNSTNAAPHARSKRKGMPVKRVNVGMDDYEMVADNEEVIVKDSLMATSENLTSASTDPEPSPAVPLPVSEAHADVSSGDLDLKLFNCRYAGCLTTCYGFEAYEQHYTAVHGGRYPCSLCSQSFTSRNNRRRHMDIHDGAAGHRRHQCVTCGRWFARADIIKEHRLTHTRSYQLGTCSKCGEVCGTKKSSLLLHLKRCFTAADIDGDIDDVKVTEPETAN